MSDSVTIEDSKGETFAEVIDVIGVSEVKKAFQKSIKEGSLHNWFKGSRSKGGKPGWVQVVSGKPCARAEGQKSTPKCVSSAKVSPFESSIVTESLIRTRILLII